MALLFSLEGSAELTLKFSSSAADLVGVSFLSLVTIQYVLNTGLDVVHGVWTGKDSESGFGCTRLICVSFGSTRLICVSFGSTRLICASFGSTRLISVSFGSTRLISVSFGSTRLICAFYGTTRLLCRVTARGRPTRGRKDA
ncbi:mucin-19-like isoform X13 [Cucumis melo var. makuwa]|uniref:Mucin-19-like isoform X13 n=1 Tax=Cucumis melo var. makuwa TaxID=1194695 RepID=A0A5A7UD10_CUCMM|nr:mucin-19-like isoform X13 [Cucumis melo var. makuwa]